MVLKPKGLDTSRARQPGELGQAGQEPLIESYKVEGNDIVFGDAVMAGTLGDQCKQYAGNSGTFLGVAVRSTQAGDSDNDKYEALDAIGVLKKGAISVFCEDAMLIGGAVRVRHEAKTATAGTATISSAPLTFIGATVPALASATYDIDIEVDGTNYPCPTALLVTDDWDGIAAKIQVVLRALTSSTETVAISGGKILVTSATTGLASIIRISQGTTGSGGGDLMEAIDAVTNMTTTIDTATHGTLFPVGGFLTNTDTGKTTLLTGVRCVEGATLVDAEKSLYVATLRLDGPFTDTDE
jgi:hypothetical protein